MTPPPAPLGSILPNPNPLRVVTRSNTKPIRSKTLRNIPGEREEPPENSPAMALAGVRIEEAGKGVSCGGGGSANGDCLEGAAEPAGAD